MSNLATDALADLEKCINIAYYIGPKKAQAIRDAVNGKPKAKKAAASKTAKPAKEPEAEEVKSEGSAD